MPEPAAQRPLCFVLMPFGIKPVVAGPAIDFDAIWQNAIRPGVEAAGLEPLRADEERTGGIIHKAMFERLLLCDYAVADLTTANANVFYELGVRHATRPATTLTVFAEGQMLPFDVRYLRCLPYRLDQDNNLTPEAAAALSQLIRDRLVTLQKEALTAPIQDSPLFELLTEYRAPDIARLKTDLFRSRVEYSEQIKKRLEELRNRKDVQAIAALEEEVRGADAIEMGVLVDLLLTWRALKQWDRMIALYDRMPAELKRSVMMREQLAFAHNRKGNREEAARILEDILRSQGDSSETLGLLGRVYKDRWSEARKAGDMLAARGHLDRAIACYLRGFEADPRDAYPGINALTLLDIKGDAKSLEKEAALLPVVRFAVRCRLRDESKADYWDYATLLELAVLEHSEEQAWEELSKAVSRIRESWEAETTANNLKLIAGARQDRRQQEPWLDAIIAELEKRSGA
jgi:tetratricopeptide (TPR) repeat protein